MTSAALSATIPTQIDLANDSRTARINAEHRQAKADARSAIEHAAHCGELLIEAKSELPHGQWRAWVEAHCEFSCRTARRYMQVAEELLRLRERWPRVASLPLRDVAHLLEKDNIHFSSDSPEWYTPAEIVGKAVDVLGAIDTDPCSNDKTNPNVPTGVHYDEHDDGLSQQWKGRVYMNPPYGRQIVDWVRRLCDQYRDESVAEAIALLPARTYTEWFALLRDYPRCFVRGRLRFSGHANTAPFPSMVVYLGHNVDRFRAAFDDLGDLYVRADCEVTA